MRKIIQNLDGYHEITIKNYVPTLKYLMELEPLGFIVVQVSNNVYEKILNSGNTNFDFEKQIIAQYSIFNSEYYKDSGGLKIFDSSIPGYFTEWNGKLIYNPCSNYHFDHSTINIFNETFYYTTCAMTELLCEMINRKKNFFIDEGYSSENPFQISSLQEISREEFEKYLIPSEKEKKLLLEKKF